MVGNGRIGLPRDGDDTSLEATETWSRLGPWTARVKAEVEAVRDGCGVLDLWRVFTVQPVRGRGGGVAAGTDCWGTAQGGADEFGIFPRQSRQNPDRDVFAALRLSDHFTLITAAAAQWHDFWVLEKDLAGGLSLTDHTTEYSTLIVCGPTSRDVFAAMETQADLTLPWLSHQTANVAGVDCALARVCFAGELGWEIHARMDDIPALYAAVLDAGAVPFGMYALNSMRVEKGYRAWKGDLSTDYSLLQGGLDRFIKFDKPQDFPGKAALLAEKQQGVSKRFVTLVMDHHDCDAPYMSPIYQGDTVVGEVTSCAMGYRTGQIVVLGMLQPQLHSVGTEVEVNVFGDRVRAVVQADQPLWDPSNARIRG